MNKKNIFVIVGVIIAILIGILLYFVTIKVNDKMKNTILSFNKNETNNTLNSNEDTTYTKDFGTYNIKQGWIESKSHSTKTKFFYIKNGTENEKTPDNIAINVGVNRYSKEEHVKFREAIVKQLNAQLSSKDVVINGNGSNTKKGDIVYQFSIEEKDCTTIQYYIVGDYKYILVHETIFNNKEETNKVAKEIINSFTWKE